MQKPDFKDLINQLDILYQCINSKVCPPFDQPAPVRLLTNYKVQMYKDVRIHDFLPIRRVLVGALHQRVAYLVN